MPFDRLWPAGLLLVAVEPYRVIEWRLFTYSRPKADSLGSRMAAVEL